MSWCGKESTINIPTVSANAIVISIQVTSKYFTTKSLTSRFNSGECNGVVKAEGQKSVCGIRYPSTNPG